MRDLQQQDKPLNDFEAALRALQPRADRLPSQGPPTPRAATDCTNPSGHEFVCIHCGCETPATVRRRRWAWPTAFGAMTTVAAVLLAMVFLQAPSSNVATIAPDESQDLIARPAPAMSYVALRNQMLRNGVESWQPIDSSDGGKVRDDASPVPCREQIENLLKELNHAG